jgi:hypothetical protein
MKRLHGERNSCHDMLNLREIGRRRERSFGSLVHMFVLFIMHLKHIWKMSKQ